MVRLAAAAEMWLGKPVIAINTATYWHALRQNNIKDKIAGLAGCLKSFRFFPAFSAEQVTRFGTSRTFADPRQFDRFRTEMALNAKTAKKLGLSVPQSMLLRADEIIE